MSKEVSEKNIRVPVMDTFVLVSPDYGVIDVLSSADGSMITRKRRLCNDFLIVISVIIILLMMAALIMSVLFKDRIEELLDGLLNYEHFEGANTTSRVD